MLFRGGVRFLRGGLRFRNGQVFRQRIVDGQQVELPDNWKDIGGAWLMPKPQETEEVLFGGTVRKFWDNGRLHVVPEGATPVLHSDMGWQYQHTAWCGRLKDAGIVQSMSRKGNCIDNGATEQVFGHMKDEFFRGRTWPDFESFKADLDAYVAHWNTRRRQVKLKGLTPEEFRNQPLAA